MIANNNKSKLNCDSFICDMVKFLTKLPQFHNKIQHLHMVWSQADRRTKFPLAVNISCSTINYGCANFIKDFFQNTMGSGDKTFIRLIAERCNWAALVCPFLLPISYIWDVVSYWSLVFKYWSSRGAQSHDDKVRRVQEQVSKENNLWAHPSHLNAKITMAYNSIRDAIPYMTPESQKVILNLHQSKSISW